MKPALLGAIAGIALAVVAMQPSCTIDRHSESLKCFGDLDCASDRTCQAGYCVVGIRMPDAFVEPEPDAAICPSACNSCDFAMNTCTIIGTGSGNINCPAGFKCNISCPSAGACGAINCGTGNGCKVDCLAADACLAVSCVTKDCDITCTGDHACDAISCTSGDCKATCTGANACSTITCNGGGDCTSTCSGGSGSAVCGNQTCTTGACTRTCDGADACGTMTCGGGACTETCSGGAKACGALSCGTGKCQATCTGIDGACDNIECGNSCQCDVGCDIGTNTCPGCMPCPDPTGGQANECEDTFGICDSAQNTSRCQKCM